MQSITIAEPTDWRARWQRVLADMKLVDDAAGEQALIEQLAAVQRPTVLAFVNAHAMNSIVGSPRFFDALHAADMLLRDGSGMASLCKMLGLPPGLNLNGTDLIPKIIRRHAGRPIALFGTQDPYLGRAREHVREVLAPESACTATHGFLEAEAYVRMARKTMPELIVLGMGMPRQEEVAAVLRAELTHPCLIVCGGAIIDFMGGKTPRAPRWMRAVGMEWLYRLGREPKRLFTRYVIGNPLFMMRSMRLAMSTPRVAGTDSRMG